MNKAVLFGVLAAATLFVGLLAYVLVGDMGGRHGSRSKGEERHEEIEKGLPAEAHNPDGTRDTPNTKAARFRLFGTVREQRGTAIFGAAIVVGSRRMISDKQGNYEIGVDEPLVTLNCWADGFLPLVNKRFIIEGDEGKLDIDLMPAASLRGRVTDSEGKPVKGARVYVIAPSRALLEVTNASNTARTDKEGRFRFPGVPPGTWDLGVRDGGHLPALLHDVKIPGSGIVEKDVVVAPGRHVLVKFQNAPDPFPDHSIVIADSRLRGKLLPPGGLGILADALVGREYVDFPVVLGTLLGHYAVGLGPADVFVQVEGMLPAKALDTTTKEVVITLVKATETEIRVFDESTREALEPKIFLDDSKDAVSFVGGAATVPADGEPHVLHFKLGGYDDARLDLPIDQKTWPEFFEVTMRPLADSEKGQFTIEFEGKFTGRFALVGRDPDGRWVWQKHLDYATGEKREVNGIAFGEYSVSVLATGMIPVVIPRVVVAKGLNDRHRVLLSEGGGVEMKVTDSAGKLLDKVGLLLKDGNGNRVDVHIMTHLSDKRAFVSVNALPMAAVARADSGLAPGVYTLTVWRAGYEPATEEFTVVGRDVSKVTISLEKK